MDIFYCVPRLIIFCRALWMTSSQVIKLMGYLAWKCVHRIMHIFASCLMSEDVCCVRYLCSGWSPFCYWVASVVLVVINLMAECVLFCNVLLIRNCIITDTACIVGGAESVKRYCICLSICFSQHRPTAACKNVAVGLVGRGYRLLYCSCGGRMLVVPHCHLSAYVYVGSRTQTCYNLQL